MLNNIGKFFNDNVNAYDEKRLSRGDYYFLEYIKSNNSHRSTLIDVGCGSGRFAKLMVNNCPDMHVTVLDPSDELLNVIRDSRIEKVIGWLPNNIPDDSQFDYVHVAHVLHHITGASVEKTRELAMLSLLKIRELLNNDGLLFLHDVFYESYLVPSATRTVIFHLLSLQEKLGFKIPAQDFIAGLKVYFFTRAELKAMLHQCGFKIVDYFEEYWFRNYKKKYLCLKDWGEVILILSKR